ncbi:OLC1v1013057C1 [Oldenlandia corymbosa var. corymbosa]|uniref:OLC1v1013057C1 n=1 Tax=Oldenlandia corymbosa var. corymbosa TaxID=529605 RepID=A0AAV1E0N0_OLDCO|nr:OLC1v1013057C1 [Oldenlandia corymbosa var. corymbosa]
MDLEILISVTLLFVGVAILVLIHVCINRAFGTARNSSNLPVSLNQTNTRRNTPPGSLCEDEIRNLPSFDYRVVVSENNDDQEKAATTSSSSSSKSALQCVVCLESFEEGQKCRLLPKCSHCFHAECIDSWLAKTGACPICRTGALLSPELTPIHC